MPGRRCAILGCSNSKIATKAMGVNVIFHNFPKGTDMVSTTTRNEWVLRCKRKNKFNPLTSQICSIHFSENNYERDLQNELLGLPIRRNLKKTAVPTLHLPKTLQEQKNPDKKTDRHSRFLERQETELIRELVEDPQPTSRTRCREEVHEESDVTPSLSFQGEKSNTSDVELRKNYSELQQKYVMLKKEYDSYKLKQERRVKTLNEQLKYYRNRYNSKQQQQRFGITKNRRLKFKKKLQETVKKEQNKQLKE